MAGSDDQSKLDEAQNVLDSAVREVKSKENMVTK
jgi:hypothetical protein